MKQINNYITEKLHIKSGMTLTISPQDKFELCTIISDRIKAHKRKQDVVGLNDIDVSNIEDFSGFVTILRTNTNVSKERLCNIDISDWDVSNMQNAQGMFMGYKKFNCDLSKWNIKNLENANAMFAGCENLDFDISKWNPEKLTHNTTWKMITNTKLQKQDWMR